MVFFPSSALYFHLNFFCLSSTEKTFCIIQTDLLSKFWHCYLCLCSYLRGVCGRVCECLSVYDNCFVDQSMSSIIKQLNLFTFISLTVLFVSCLKQKIYFLLSFFFFWPEINEKFRKKKLYDYEKKSKNFLGISHVFRFQFYSNDERLLSNFCIA